MSHYVDKNNFLKLIERYQNNKNDEKAFDELVKIFIKIAKGVINKKKYYKYIEYNDLLLESCASCITVIDKFDKEKISSFKKDKVNPFSFFNQVINYTIFNMLKNNDKHRVRNVCLYDLTNKKSDKKLSKTENFKDLEQKNEHNIDFFNECFIKYLLTKKEEIRKYGKIFSILLNYLIFYLEEYKYFDKKIFFDYVKEKNVFILEKQFNKFFLILQKVLDMEEVLQIIYYK